VKNLDPVNVGITIAAILLFGGIIGVNLLGFRITQQALNEQCGTNYSLMQVALAGDNLSRLCQIKNQVVTVK
jgi:hypothetical protein